MKVVAIALAVVVGLIALVGGGVAFWVFSTSIPSSVAVKPTSGPAPATHPSTAIPEVAPPPRVAINTPDAPTPETPGKPEPVDPPVPGGANEPEMPKGETLPDFPMVDAKNKQVPLHPDKKSIIAEVQGEGDKKKVVRVGIIAEVCLRQGPLEQLMCKKNTKEHEAIVSVDMDAELIHLAITVAGGKAGTPTGFIDPKTDEPKHIPATGSKVKVLVHYKRDGKLYTHPAQDWIWDTRRKAPIQYTWVFAGSQFINDPSNPNVKPYYGANSGDIVSISNFPYSTLEFSEEISKDAAQLTYEARTDKIPPLTSKVWVLIEVLK